MKVVSGPHTKLEILGSDSILMSSVPAGREPADPTAWSQPVSVANPAVADVVVATGMFPTSLVSTRLISILYLSGRVCSMLSEIDSLPAGGTVMRLAYTRRQATS